MSPDNTTDTELRAKGVQNPGRRRALGTIGKALFVAAATVAGVGCEPENAEDVMTATPAPSGGADQKAATIPATVVARQEILPAEVPVVSMRAASEVMAEKVKNSFAGVAPTVATQEVFTTTDPVHVSADGTEFTPGLLYGSRSENDGQFEIPFTAKVLIRRKGESVSTVPVVTTGDRLPDGSVNGFYLHEAGFQFIPGQIQYNLEPGTRIAQGTSQPCGGGQECWESVQIENQSVVPHPGINTLLVGAHDGWTVDLNDPETAQRVGEWSRQPWRMRLIDGNGIQSNIDTSGLAQGETINSVSGISVERFGGTSDSGGLGDGLVFTNGQGTVQAPDGSFVSEGRVYALRQLATASLDRINVAVDAGRPVEPGSGGSLLYTLVPLNINVVDGAHQFVDFQTGEVLFIRQGENVVARVTSGAGSSEREEVPAVGLALPRIVEGEVGSELLNLGSNPERFPELIANADTKVEVRSAMDGRIVNYAIYSEGDPSWESIRQWTADWQNKLDEPFNPVTHQGLTTREVVSEFVDKVVEQGVHGGRFNTVLPVTGIAQQGVLTEQQVVDVLPSEITQVSLIWAPKSLFENTGHVTLTEYSDHPRDQRHMAFSAQLIDGHLYLLFTLDTENWSLEDDFFPVGRPGISITAGSQFLTAIGHPPDQAWQVEQLNEVNNGEVFRQYLAYGNLTENPSLYVQANNNVQKVFAFGRGVVSS